MLSSEYKLYGSMPILRFTFEWTWPTPPYLYTFCISHAYDQSLLSTKHIQLVKEENKKNTYYKSDS